VIISWPRRREDHRRARVFLPIEGVQKQPAPRGPDQPAVLAIHHADEGAFRGSQGRSPLMPRISTRMSRSIHCWCTQGCQRRRCSTCWNSLCQVRAFAGVRDPYCEADRPGDQTMQAMRIPHNSDLRSLTPGHRAGAGEFVGDRTLLSGSEGTASGSEAVSLSHMAGP